MCAAQIAPEPSGLLQDRRRWKHERFLELRGTQQVCVVSGTADLICGWTLQAQMIADFTRHGYDVHHTALVGAPHASPMLASFIPTIAAAILRRAEEVAT